MMLVQLSGMLTFHNTIGTFLRDFKQLKLKLLFNVEQNMMIICFSKPSKIVFAFSIFLEITFKGNRFVCTHFEFKLFH